MFNILIVFLVDTFSISAPWWAVVGPGCHDAQQIPLTARYRHADWVYVERLNFIGFTFFPSQSSNYALKIVYKYAYVSPNHKQHN